MGDAVDAVRAAWTDHVAVDETLLDRLLVRHRERHRRYHTIDHVAAVVGHVATLARSEAIDDVGAVVAAALFHDAVYEPSSPANERASARLARRDLAALGWASDRIERVATMIEGTATHLDPADVDTAVLFDADLAILGAPEPVYVAYVDAVRAEYRHVDDETWTTGRAGVLRSFLQRDPLYATDTGRTTWEHSARRNLADEIASLATGG